ncbi:MAG: amidohydrolase family protein [bacterium]|nr:amidohydrolase family protein [bacterium]
MDSLINYHDPMPKHILLALILLAGVSNAYARTTPVEGIASKTPELKAFTNARIIVSPERTVEKGVLVIDHGKVVAVGADIAVPEGAEVVDLLGRTIYPGFVEPYSEYGLESVPEIERNKSRQPIYAADRMGGDAWNDAIHAQEDWVRHFKPNKKAAEDFLRVGFTCVQSGRLDGVLRGRAFVASLGDGLPNDLVINPQSWQFASFNKGSSPQAYPSSQMGCIALIRQTLYDVDWYLQAHAAYSENPEQAMPEFNAAIAALANVRNEGFLFEAGDDQVTLRFHRIATEFGMPTVIVGSGHEYEVIEAIKEAGRTLVLPLTFPQPPGVKTYDEELDVCLADLRRWERAPSNPAVLEQNGVSFAFTSRGLKNKEDFLKNVRKAVAFGLSKETALAAMTTIPAEICGVGNDVGSLVTGRAADFIVCDGDIFDDNTNVLSAWTHGVETNLLARDRVDFGGKYAFEFEGLAFELSVEDNYPCVDRRLSGKLRTDSLTIDLKHVKEDGARLNFTAPFDTLRDYYCVRFSGQRSGNTLSGRAALNNGNRVEWTAVWSGPLKDKKDSESSKAVDTVLISRLSYPNLAYGRESRPPLENLLIKNGTVWTSEDDGVLEETDILIKDGKFERLGKNLEAPSGYRTIDASGRHVTAGVIDEHSHVAITGNVNEGTSAVSSEVRIADIVDAEDIALYRSLAGGVTMARLLHGSANPIGGEAQIIKYRWGSAAEDLKFTPAPPSIKFALGENVKQSNWGDEFKIRYPQTRMGVETIIRDAFQRAVEYEADWAAYNALSRRDREKTVPPRKNLRLEALVEVLHSRMFITCHSYVQSEILMLMRLAEHFGFRITTFTHILEGYKVAAEMARHGATGGAFSDWWAYKFEVYDAIPQNPGIMHEQGVIVSVNSDSERLQRLLNQEAAKSVQYCGMSQEDAWKMVTINPAKQLKADQWVGSIKPGKDADFVIWNHNPLSVYAKPEQTWVEGRKYFDLDQDLALRESIREERNALIQKVLKVSDDDKWKHHKKKKPGTSHYPDKSMSSQTREGE